MTKFAMAARRNARPKASRTLLSTALLWTTLIVVGVVIYDKTSPAPAPAEASTAQDTLHGRAKVIDGDGLIIAQQEIRLHGIDAFEYDQTCGSFACGQASKAHLTRLVADQAITCWARDTDRYGRVVAICKAGGKDIGAEQVKSGLAVAYTRYSDVYVPLEKSARDQQRGAWARGFIPPETHRYN